MKKEDEESTKESEKQTEDTNESPEKDVSVSDIWEGFNDEQKKAVAIIVGKMVEDQKKEPTVKHSENVEPPKTEDKGVVVSEKKPKTIEELLGSLPEEQAKAVNMVIASIKSGKTDLIKGKKEVAARTALMSDTYHSSLRYSSFKITFCLFFLSNFSR